MIEKINVSTRFVLAAFAVFIGFLLVFLFLWPKRIPEVPEFLASRYGNPNAKVTLVVYSDIFCDYCRQWETQIRPYLEPYIASGELQYIHVTIPFIESMSFLSKNLIAASYCTERSGGERGRFDAWLYTELDVQNFSQTQTITSRAVESGANQTDFIDCFIGPERKIIDQQIESQSKPLIESISGVPAVYLDGKKIEAWNNPAFFIFYLQSKNR